MEDLTTLYDNSRCYTQGRVYEQRAEGGRKGAARTAQIRLARRRLGITLHVSRTPMNDEDVPAIRINGKWLSYFGFLRGQTVTVKAEYGTITITRAEDTYGIPAK